MLPAFELKNSTEYSIESTAKVSSNKPASLFLITFDHHFGSEREEAKKNQILSEDTL